MIIRTFHPVGQGAFYSERHNDFNIVYDCGTEWKNRGKKVIDKTIQSSFSKEDVIDILFISHFDYDHVSKIKVFYNHTDIGFIMKKGSTGKVDEFCFDGDRFLEDVEFILRNGKLILSKTVENEEKE